MSPSVGTAVVLATVLAMLTLGVWSWQRSVFRSQQADVKTDPWKKVESDYPITQELPPVPKLSVERVDAVIRANPFSPARRSAAQPTEGGPASAGQAVVEEPDVAQFVYKGRINLGNRQRAIVEDTGSHKTYFLEVGQAVAGFKVLDIAENRVVLLDPSTNQEVVVSMATPSSP